MASVQREMALCLATLISTKLVGDIEDGIMHAGMFGSFARTRQLPRSIVDRVLGLKFQCTKGFMELIMACRLQKLRLIIYLIETMHALHLPPFYFILDILQKYSQK